MFKNPSFLFDMICTVVWLLLAIRYARKGFLASVVQLVGSLLSLIGARAFSAWGAGQVFNNFLANGFRDQIAASISAGGVVDLSGIAEKYAGFLPESFRASIVEACERSVSAVLSDNAVVLADVIVQKVPRCSPPSSRWCCSFWPLRCCAWPSASSSRCWALSTSCPWLAR